MGTLPLFPLGSVLFPGLVLPLQIFEERYRALMADLLPRPAEERRFGVIAIRRGREVGVDGVGALYDVGCVAQIRRHEEQPDGRYLVVTVGTERFRLEEFAAAGTPYLTGSVTMLDEEDGAASEFVAPVQRAFAAYIDALGTARDTEIELPDLPDEPGHLSYLVAATTLAENAEKQALLAAATHADRLRDELTLLRRETMLLTTLTAAPAPELTRLPQSPN